MSRAVGRAAKIPRTRATSAATGSHSSAPSYWGAILLALAVLGIGWRLWILHRLETGPLPTHLTADALVYWRWASELLSPPPTSPHQPFFLGPLYPYWLAAMRTLLGDSIHRILVVQCLLAGATVVVVADAVRRVASARAAAVTGLVLSVYAMSVLFNMLIVMETLLLFVEAVLLWILMCPDRSRPWALVAAAACVGIASLGRPAMVVLITPVLVVAWADRPSRLEYAKRCTAILVTVFALSIPALWHNWKATGEFIPITYSAGYNAYVGNGPGANGTYREVADPDPPAEPGLRAEGGTERDGRRYLERSTGRSLTAQESSGAWLSATWAHVRDDPWHALRKFGSKLLLLFNHRELPQLESPAAFEESAGPLGIPVDAGFAFFGVLGLAGLWWAWKEDGRIRAVAIWVICVAAATASVFVVDRYRIHLIVPLSVLASLTIDRIVAAAKNRSLAPSLGVVTVAALVVWAPLIPANAAHREWTVASALGEAWLERDQSGRAIPYLRHAVAIDQSGALPAGDSLIAPLRASVYFELGLALARVGETHDAIEALEQGVELAPGSHLARLRLAELLAVEGATDRAVVEFGHAGLGRNDAAEWLTVEAARLAGSDPAAMESRLRAAVAIAPGFERSLIPVVRICIQQGLLDEAQRMLDDGQRAGLDADVYWVHNAWIAAAGRDPKRARRMLERVSPNALTTDPRVRATLELMSGTKRQNVP